MTSTIAKVALISYCRFARQYKYVATEVSIAGGLADVLASDGKNLVEYEIKVSLQDLLKDKYKSKHLIYDPTPITWEGNVGKKGDIRIELIQGERPWEPLKWNAVSFDKNNIKCNFSGWIGFDTQEEAKDLAEKTYGYVRNAPNTLYYVIPTLLWEKHEEKILNNLHPSYGIITFEDTNYTSLTVRKKAKKLHKNNIDPQMLLNLVSRMSSELATLTSLYHYQVEHFTKYGKMIEQKFILKEDE